MSGCSHTHLIGLTPVPSLLRTCLFPRVPVLIHIPFQLLRITHDSKRLTNPNCQSTLGKKNYRFYTAKPHGSRSHRPPCQQSPSPALWRESSWIPPRLVKLKTPTAHRLTSVLLVLTTKLLGYPILNRTQLEVGRDWGRMLVEVSQNPEHNLWNKNLYYVCNGMNWSGTERIVVIVQRNILLFFCARTISISQAYHNMFHMWNQQDISFGQVPPVCMAWVVGIVWMVGMVCKSVGYGMFDMTVWVCMVCMVCMITMMGMEYFLCKIGMVCMACIFAIVCMVGVVITFQMYGMYGMYDRYDRYGMHGIIDMYGRYGIC